MGTSSRSRALESARRGTGGAPEDRWPLLDLLKDWKDEEDGEPCRRQRNLRLPLPADHAFGFAKRGRQPFGINSIYDLGDWCAPWWRKPVSYADLDAFFESNGCGWLRQSIGIGSWRGDAGEDEKAARIIRASLEQHGLTLERARARYGKRRVSEARKWAETVAFFATGCSFLDIAEVVDRSVAQVSKEIYDTWCKDYYIGCVDNICKLAFDGYLVREQGLDEDGVEPGEVIVLEEYMDGETQELRSLGTSDVHGV